MSERSISDLSLSLSLFPTLTRPSLFGASFLFSFAICSHGREKEREGEGEWQPDGRTFLERKDGLLQSELRCRD